MIKLSKKNKLGEYFFMKNNLSETNKIIICVFCLLLELAVIKFNISFFAGIFCSFVSIALGAAYGSVVAFFVAIFYILEWISVLRIKLSLNQISLFGFQIVGIIGGIGGFLVGFLYRYLDRFLWCKKKILRLIASIFCSNIVGDFINFLGIFVIFRILPDGTTKMALFLATITTFARTLVRTIINSIILLIMLKIYDKIVEKN